MKLLYITNSINGTGGLERVLATKINYFVEKYHYDVEIVILNDGYTNPFFKFSKQIKFHSVKVNGNPIVYFKNYRKGIQNIINKINPDIISVCDDGLKGLLFPLFFKLNQPVIYERHASFDIFKNKSKLKNLFFKLKKTISLYGAKKFDKFIVLTSNNLKEWGLPNTQVIPNPLPFYPKSSSQLTNKTIIAVGSHNYNKGYDRLIKIWKNINLIYPNWKLEIYGKSNVKLNLESIIKQNGLENNITLFKPITNIYEKYLNASIFVLPSRSEGFGMVLIEAMACGLPVISFDCPSGPRDIIKNNKDGYLIKNNDLQEFEEKLLYLISNFEKRKELGLNAKKNVIIYNDKNIADIWNNLFIELIK